MLDTTYHGGPQVLVYFDLDNSPNTGLTWGWWASGLDAYVQLWPMSESGYYGYYEHTQQGESNWDWTLRDSTRAAWSVTYNDVGT